MKKLGVIVNPLAGMGGRVGLKGSDGEEILARALTLGARPEAPARTVRALKELHGVRKDLKVLCASKDMGERELQEAGMTPDDVLGFGSGDKTTAGDTVSAVREMKKRGCDLILFAGGDGTARDVLTAVGQSVPVLGIPAGVKIHSAVFARTPVLAGQTAKEFLTGGLPLSEAEVMDIDEEAFRAGRVSAALYGYLSCPRERENMQGVKSPTPDDQESLAGIASQIAKNMEDGVTYILGPGTTTRAVMDALGLPCTLLGVDVVRDKGLILSDAGEQELLAIVSGGRFKVVVTPIGGQGILFGRGNQQISPRILKKAGRENIIVAATHGKILEFGGRAMTLDTGDEEVNKLLGGYYRVVTGYGEETVLSCK